jgi:iron complex outermembrane receptor protein
MTYAQYSTGFKGGGTNPRPFFASQSAPFGPETLKATEIGAKADLSSHIRINVALYSNKYNGIQLTALTCPSVPVAPCALPVNAGNADVQGGELEAQLRFGGLMFEASVSKLDFEYTFISPNAGVAGGVGVQKGMITPYTPESKIAFGAQYEFATAFGSLTPRLDWAHQSEFFVTAVNAPTNRMDGYGLLSGRITWKSEDGAWQAALLGTNLLDKYYNVNGLDFAAPPFFASFTQPGRPREYSLSVKRSF